MNDRMEVRELAHVVRRLWWLPALLAFVGAAIGMTAAENVPPVYRSTATVLVGPTDGAVTHSSTIRTSEDLAAFYADMARRQVVLEPVVKKLRLDGEWTDLRDRVGALVPKENPRLVAVTVVGGEQTETDAVANELVNELVSLSPGATGPSVQTFVNEQTENLKQTIEETQKRILALKTAMATTSDPDKQGEIQRELTQLEKMVGDWQRIYVDLIAAEPSSGAGGMQIIDQANAVTAMGRSGPAKQALVGGLVGALLGVLLTWLLHHRERARHRSTDVLPGAAAVPFRSAGGGQANGAVVNGHAQDTSEVTWVRGEWR